MSVPTLEGGGTTAVASSDTTPESGSGAYFATFADADADPGATPGGQPSIGGPSLTITTQAGHQWVLADRDLVVLLAVIALGAHLSSVWGGA